jgi:hypothetical protein
MECLLFILFYSIAGLKSVPIERELYMCSKKSKNDIYIHVFIFQLFLLIVECTPLVPLQRSNHCLVSASLKHFPKNGHSSSDLIDFNSLLANSDSISPGKPLRIVSPAPRKQSRN